MLGRDPIRHPMTAIEQALFGALLAEMYNSEVAVSPDIRQQTED